MFNFDPHKIGSTCNTFFGNIWTHSVGCLYSLDWTTGLTFFATKNHLYALQLDLPTSRVANYVYAI